MKRSLPLFLVLLSCGQSDTTSTEPSSATSTSSAKLTTAAPPTAAHGAIVWKDATGAAVPMFLQFGFGGGAWTDETGGMFIDANGIVWSFGVPCGGTTKVCLPYAQYNNQPYATYWSDPNCSGTEYAPYVHAGFAFALAEPSGNTTRAFNKNANVSLQFMQSSQAPGAACSNTIVHVLVGPVTDAPVVTPPASVPFTPPLHAEMVN